MRDVLRKLEPNYELLKSVLTFKGMMQGEVLEVARSIIRRVVEELRRRLHVCRARRRHSKAFLPRQSGD